MILSRKQLRQIIREMYSPNFEFMGIMSDIGSPMVKQLAKYVIPHQNALNFRISQDKYNVRVFMYYKNTEIGSVKARLLDPEYGKFDPKFDPKKEKINLFEIKSAFLKLGQDVPLLFKEKGFGPIMYELCLEIVSTMKDSEGERNYYLTCDRNSLQPDAYNVWAFYYHNRRNDVEQKQLDSSYLPDEYSITGNPNLRYTGFTSEDFYEMFRETPIFPQGPPPGVPTDEEIKNHAKQTIGNYIDYAKSKDPLMKAYRKNETPFYNLINELGMII